MIIVGLLLGYMGLKRGLYVMFASLFNLMFAIFIAVLSTPTILKMTPGYENNGYYAAGCIFMMFLLVFGLLQFFCWFYLFKTREDYFPEILDKLGSAILGFLCGYVVVSLLIFLVTIMPLKSDPIPLVGTHENLLRLARPGIVRVCNFLGAYSLECFDGDVEETIETLVTINDTKVDEPVLMYIPQEEPPDNQIESVDHLRK